MPSLLIPSGLSAIGSERGHSWPAGYLLAAAMCLGFLLEIPSIWYLVLLFAIGGIYLAAEDGLEGAMTADLLPEAVRGTGYGVLATVNGLGDFVSSVVVGLLWVTISPAAGFVYAAIRAWQAAS